MVWRTSDGVTRLVPAKQAWEQSVRKMGNYDLYPKDVREHIAETGKRP